MRTVRVRSDQRIAQRIQQRVTVGRFTDCSPTGNDPAPACLVGIAAVMFGRSAHTFCMRECVSACACVHAQYLLQLTHSPVLSGRPPAHTRKVYPCLCIMHVGFRMAARTNAHMRLNLFMFVFIADTKALPTGGGLARSRVPARVLGIT